MKKRNLVIAVLLVAFVTIMMTSCYTPAFAPFLGKYSRTVGDSKTTWEFKNDGTGSITGTTPVGSLTITFDYEFDAKTLTTAGLPHTYKMSNFNKTLTLDDVDYTKE